MKNLLIAATAAAALILSGSAYAADAGSGSAKKAHKAGKKSGKVMTKGGNVSKAHHCMKDGAEIKTSDKYKGGAGKTIRREKTCKAEGGTWEGVNAAATGSGSGS